MTVNGKPTAEEVFDAIEVINALVDNSHGRYVADSLAETLPLSMRPLRSEDACLTGLYLTGPALGWIPDEDISSIVEEVRALPAIRAGNWVLDFSKVRAVDIV